MSEHVPELAGSYRLTDRGLLIDGNPFPWYIAEQGPRTESYEPSKMHVLWVPIIVDAIIPPDVTEAPISVKPVPKMVTTP